MNKIHEGRRSPPAGALESGSPLDAPRDATRGSAVPRRVVHCRRDRYDIYIGRGSKWGNPFVLTRGNRDNDLARSAVIASYRKWLAKQPQLLAALPDLRGKTLGCFCAPKPCHGDVLAELANG